MPILLQMLLTSVMSLPFALFQGWDAVATVRLNLRLKALRDAGDPVTMVELAKSYPEPPPGKNAATPLNAAFKELEARKEDPARVLARLPLIGTAQLPPLDEPLSPVMLRAIRGYLADHAEILELLHKAAALDECKFELDFTKGPGMLLPHLSKLRQGGRLLALEAIERTEGGKADAAADSLVAGLRLGEHLRREPLLISALVRIAADAIAVGQMERWASRAKPSVQALERVEAAVAAAGDRRIIERAMMGERCFGIDIYDNYVLKPGGGEMLGAFGGEGPMLAPHILRLIPDAYFKGDMACYLDIMNDYVAAARKPYPGNYLAGARVGQELDQRIPPYYFVARMILPALSRMFGTGQKHLARCDSARVALAALRYRAKQGRLPAGLAALVPGFLPAMPPDPFDGKPLRYKADAAGLTVYAVGEDGKDDGGLTEAPEGNPPDIGFRIRWPKAQF